METKTFTLKTDRKLIAKELLVEGSTKKVECTNYWDHHGERWDRAKTQLNLTSTLKKSMKSGEKCMNTTLISYRRRHGSSGTCMLTERKSKTLVKLLVIMP